MNKQITMLVIVIALVTFSGVQAFQLNKIQQEDIGSFLSSESESSSSGESYEQMTARMHPDQAQAGNTRSSQSSPSSASMVGGC